MICEDSAKKCHFLFSEFVRTRQLTRWTTKNNGKDKSSRSSVLLYCYRLFRIASLITLIWYSSFSKLLSAIVWNIESLLVIGGIELNPGPVREEEGFRLKSQNCRGLTDRNKLFRLLKRLYPNKGSRPCTGPSIACLQETHSLDTFTLDNYFKGTAIVDNGLRNQRGVCILIPESFEVCSASTSGVGRWCITVIKAKNVQLLKKYVIVNLYAPNCHREATAFYQDLFHSLDIVTQDMIQLNQTFDVAIVGDFNVVLDYQNGASSRIGSRSERDLAKLVKELMVDRNFFEAIPLPGDEALVSRN